MASSTCFSVATGERLSLASDSVMRTMASSWRTVMGMEERDGGRLREQHHLLGDNALVKECVRSRREANNIGGRSRRLSAV